MTYRITKSYSQYKDELLAIVENFDSYSDEVVKAERNSIKKVPFKGIMLNVKAFKVPNIINQISYRFFRKSKAERSYLYAHKLLSLDIQTPQPIAYFEFSSVLRFGKSFYLSEQIIYDLTFRELISTPDLKDWEQILRAFARFTFKLHENDVMFLDHSPGNTLIKLAGNTYMFYLVDLNRMQFKAMDLNERMKNFARLSASEAMIEIMSDEYSKCYHQPYNDVLRLMSKHSKTFREDSVRKRKLKKTLKFWKR